MGLTRDLSCHETVEKNMNLTLTKSFMSKDNLSLPHLENYGCTGWRL